MVIIFFSCAVSLIVVDEDFLDVVDGFLDEDAGFFADVDGFFAEVEGFFAEEAGFFAVEEGFFEDVVLPVLEDVALVTFSSSMEAGPFKVCFYANERAAGIRPLRMIQSEAEIQYRECEEKDQCLL